MCQLLHNTQFPQSDFNLSERLTRRICRLNDCSEGKFLRLLGRLFHNFGPIDISMNVSHMLPNVTQATEWSKQLRWPGFVNFHCMQMALVMRMRFIFGDD